MSMEYVPPMKRVYELTVELEISPNPTEDEAVKKLYENTVKDLKIVSGMAKIETVKLEML